MKYFWQHYQPARSVSLQTLIRDRTRITNGIMQAKLRKLCASESLFTPLLTFEIDLQGLHKVFKWLNIFYKDEQFRSLSSVFIHDCKLAVEVLFTCYNFQYIYHLFFTWWLILEFTFSRPDLGAWSSLPRSRIYQCHCRREFLDRAEFHVLWCITFWQRLRTTVRWVYAKILLFAALTKSYLEHAIQRDIFIILLFHRSTSSTGIIGRVTIQKYFYFLAILKNENQSSGNEASN